MMVRELFLLQRKIDVCRACRLGEFREDVKMKSLAAIGAVKPKVMFVGINPSTRNMTLQEGYEGRRAPFIGPTRLPFYTILAEAGILDEERFSKVKGSKVPIWMKTKMLSRMLEEAGYYVTAVVRCPSPKNRLPLGDEVEACRHFLIDEVSIVDPELICALGLLPLQVLAAPRINSLKVVMESVKKGGEELRSKREFGSRRIIPCPFPQGRGLSAGYSTVIFQFKTVASLINQPYST